MPHIPVRMLRIFYAIVIISLNVAKAEESTQRKKCSIGWFGDNCKYLCHCESDKPCEKDGRCPNRCAPGYMGEDCQNVIAGGWSNQHTAHEGVDYSCPTDETREEVVITLKQAQVVRWARVWTNTPISDAHLKLTVQVNGGNKDCPRPVVEQVTARKMDVFCPNITEAVTSLRFATLAAEAIKLWCKVSVAGGRNLAIGQNVSASSSSFTNQFLPEYVVDGMMPNRFLQSRHTCVQTKFDVKANGFVTVMFKEPVDAYKFNIYARPECMERQKNLNIKVFDVEGVLVFSQTLQTPRYLWAIIPTTAMRNVKEITFSRPPSKGKSYEVDGVLNFCELEVLGDCPYEAHGIGCDIISKPATPGDFCTPKSGCNGACAIGRMGLLCNITCPDHMYGGNCSTQCSNYCVNKTCHSEDGACTFGCLDGASPPLCLMENAAPLMVGEESSLLNYLLVLVAAMVVVGVAISELQKYDQKDTDDGNREGDCGGEGGEGEQGEEGEEHGVTEEQYSVSQTPSRAVVEEEAAK